MSQDPPPPPMQPPPPPTFTPPAKSSYHSIRQEELDAVRRRGLAKIFNKHFTTVSTKIQHERAAAELALAELERRKAELSANPKSYSGGMTLTQLEKLYMELKRRKGEVFRKERETQELYRRYVSQYGGEDGKQKSSSMHKGMPILHENALNDTVWQSDLMLAKATEKNEATKDSDVGKLADQYINECSNAIQTQEYLTSNIGKVSLDHYSPATGTDVNLAPDHKAIDYKASDYKASDYKVSDYKVSDYKVSDYKVSDYKAADYQSPDYKTKSPDGKKMSSESKQPKPFDSPAPTSITSNGSPLSGVVLQNRDEAKQEEKSPSVIVSLQGESVNDDSLLGGVMVTTKNPNKLDDSDDSSTMSGLTTIDGATVVEAEWRLTEFLRVETENIRKMFADEDEAKNEGESDCNDLISDNSTPSIIVGEVSQAAKKAEEMVKQMEAATAWMQDPTLLDSDSDEEPDDDDDTIPENLEWRCFWSEDHDREYFYNAETGQTCWTKPQDVEIDYSTMKKDQCIADDEDYDDINSIASGAMDNDADSVTVKDYTKSRRILVDTQALNPTEFSNEEMIDVFRPDNDAVSISSRGSVRQSSKVMQYRRKRARNQRMKRRLKMAVCLIVVVSLYYYLRIGKVTSPERNETEGSSKMDIKEAKNYTTTDQDIHEKTIETKEDNGNEEASTTDVVSNTVHETQNKEVVSSTDQDRVQREQNERKEEESEAPHADSTKESNNYSHEVLPQVGKVAQESVKSGFEREGHEVEESTKQESGHQKAEAPVDVDRQAQKGTETEAEELVAKNPHTKHGNEDIVAVSINQNERSGANNKQLDENVNTQISRPLNCAIPFAYISSKKCRDLASTKPIYDCKALTDSMME